MAEFKIEEYVKPEPKINEDIEQYLDAVDALIDAGDGQQVTIQVETGTARKQRLAFQAAARLRERTARCVNMEQGETVDSLTFILRPKIVRAASAIVDEDVATADGDDSTE